ncbi:MAG: hypothetical protein ACMUEL_02680 [Flavobacteriales bacterium Tduv]
MMKTALIIPLLYDEVTFFVRKNVKGPQYQPNQSTPIEKRLQGVKAHSISGKNFITLATESTPTRWM